MRRKRRRNRRKKRKGEGGGEDEDGDYMQWSAMPEQKKLTKCGKLQAVKTAKALKNMCGRPPVRHIISSPMVRARETAEMIMRQFTQHKLHVDHELEEGQPSTLSKMRFERRYFVPSQGCDDQADILVCHVNIIRYLIHR